MDHQFIVSTSQGAGGTRFDMKMVPGELHKRIIDKFGSYQDMYDGGHEDEYEEFLNLPDVKPFETFYTDNE